MARVIGKDEKHVHEVTCKNCASVIEYTKSEEQEHVGKDCGGGTDIRRWIICPSCGSEVTTYHC